MIAIGSPARACMNPPMPPLATTRWHGITSGMRLAPHAPPTARGALFTRAVRRWPFGAAALVSVAASVARYLADPWLPAIPEVILGAIVYTGLLGVANAWLLYWSESLLPPLLASSLFFAAYRALRVE